MNARFQRVATRAGTYLNEILSEHHQLRSSVPFNHRHSEHLAAAGFGYPNLHQYLKAANARIERCQGYYVPNSAMIKERMAALRYPAAIVEKCCAVFQRAVSNDADNAAYALHDGLLDERTHDEGAANHDTLKDFLKQDVLREESALWKTLAKFGIDENGDTEQNLTVTIDLPPDFPSQKHFEKVVDVPFSVVYDLDQGEDPEALFYRTNRQLGLRGNLRLQPSGKRGWAYPTLRLNETPFIDHRSPAEQRGEYPVHQGPDFDDDEFDRGTATGRAGAQPSAQASLAFLAGWVLDANGMNGSGHMSTGRIDEAFRGAWDNAKTLDMLSKHQAFDLAANACRYLASNRIRRALEELIQENAADDGGW